MNHHQLHEKCLKAMGGVVPLGFREEFSRWHAQEGTELWLRYEWIKHPGFYTWLIEEPEMDWHEGTEGIRFWIVN